MEMDYDVWKCYIRDNIEPYLESIEVWQCITALGIKPFKKDDGEWCFRYGDEQSGISGFGRTINEAAMDFYCNLKYDDRVYTESELTKIMMWHKVGAIGVRSDSHKFYRIVTHSPLSPILSISKHNNYNYDCHYYKDGHRRI